MSDNRISEKPKIRVISFKALARLSPPKKQKPA